MITYLEGTVFNAPVKTYVNTVNCAGIMGAGIALEFKLRYPEMFQDYVAKCKSKKMKVGTPRIYEYSENVWIMNFPTKGHWRYPSKIAWIEQGLKYFAENYKKRNIGSIAFPKLGTNNGGLEWKEVKVLMEKYLSDLEGIGGKTYEKIFEYLYKGTDAFLASKTGDKVDVNNIEIEQLTLF